MVAYTEVPGAACSHFVLRPNRSLTWRGALIVFWVIFAIYAVIGLAFATVGLWLILPFAGLELIALGIGLYIVSHRTSRCEVISVDREKVEVQQGRLKPEQIKRFDRAWAWVRLEPGSHRWHPSRLLIGSHGRGVEVGSFLNESERLGLARELQRLMAAP